jgi:uracil-DNA glycosylase family 4
LFTGKDIGYSIDEVNARIRACEKCEAREHVFSPLPGFGCKKEPMLLVVGQYPGRGEDVLGQPMSKEAGKFIRQQFYNLGLDDRQIYWTNTACCTTPPEENELPESQESACAPFLEMTIDALRPKLIVGMGNVTRRRMFRPKHMDPVRKKAQSLLDVRFQLWDYRGYPLTFVANPAGVLRKKSFERQAFEEDMKRDFDFLRGLIHQMGLRKKK